MPVPIVRYALVALLGLGALLLVLLLVRPFIFTFASPRDDASYPVIGASEVDAGPQLVEILLNDSHGLLGEVVDEDRVGVTVAVAPLPGREGYSVVSAWSPVNDCPLTLGSDRLLDCDGEAWTYQGFSIDPAHPPLQSFPTEVRQGAVVVDFTHPTQP